MAPFQVYRLFDFNLCGHSFNLFVFPALSVCWCRVGFWRGERFQSVWQQDRQPPGGAVVVHAAAAWKRTKMLDWSGRTRLDKTRHPAPVLRLERIWSRRQRRKDSSPRVRRDRRPLRGIGVRVWGVRKVASSSVNRKDGCSTEIETGSGDSREGATLRN